MKTEDSLEALKIRAYGRTELAQLYFPNLCPQVAYRKLQYWIDVYPGLRQQLIAHGYRLHARTFLPIHVQLIVDAIGQP